MNKNNIVNEKQIKEHFVDRKIIPVLFMDIYRLLNDLEDNHITEETIAQLMSVREEDVPEQVRLVMSDAIGFFDKEINMLRDLLTRHIIDMFLVHLEEKNRDYEEGSSEISKEYKEAYGDILAEKEIQKELEKSSCKDDYINKLDNPEKDEAI